MFVPHVTETVRQATPVDVDDFGSDHAIGELTLAAAVVRSPERPPRPEPERS